MKRPVKPQINVKPTVTEEVKEAQMGDMVRYVLPNGSVRPALVTGAGDGLNLQVFVDGSNDGYSADQVAVWRECVGYSAEYEAETWHWAQ